MKYRRAKGLLSCVAAAALVAGLAGCYGGPAGRYRANPSPEVGNLTMTDDEIANRLTVTNNQNTRMIWNDLGKLFLMDRPSRLNAAPSSY